MKPHCYFRDGEWYATSYSFVQIGRGRTPTDALCDLHELINAEWGLMDYVTSGYDSTKRFERRVLVRFGVFHYGVHWHLRIGHWSYRLWRVRAS